MNSKKKLRKTIGLRLKELRNALSFTQEAMASVLDTGRPNYTRIEVGDTFLNHLFLYKLATKFNVSMNWLICGRGRMFHKKKKNMEKKYHLENPTSPEIVELLEWMREKPILFHEVMEFFYRYKHENKASIEAILNINR